MPLEKGSSGSIHKVRWGFSSIQSLSHVPLFANPWAAACQAFLSITSSWSLPKLMPIESVMPSNHLILCHPLLLPPSIFSSIRVFSNESALCIRWPKYWSFSFNIRWERGCYFRGEWWSMREGVSENLLLLCHLKICHWISLVAQWWRICLLTQIGSLVRAGFHMPRGN